jgi:hypothetical protein
MKKEQLPTFEECEIKVKAGSATALEAFIHENEPAGLKESDLFRQGLADLLSENSRQFLKTQLRKSWMDNNYSPELIERVIEIIDNPDKLDDESQWIEIPNFNFLECVKHVTSPVYEEIFVDPIRKDEVNNDIISGVTFAIYEKDGELFWER